LRLLGIAAFVAVFPLVIFGLCFHAAMLGGPIMSDDMWFLSKVLFCALAPFAATLITGILSKGSLVSAWIREFLVLIVGFAVIAGLLRSGVITFDLRGHAPAIWRDPDYDYTEVYEGGDPIKIGEMEDGEFQLSADEIRIMRDGCLHMTDAAPSASCLKNLDCMKHSEASEDWKARNCGQVARREK
jgi:hypothetical protein